MYVVTKQAAIWSGSAVVPKRASRPKRVQRWAERPLHTPHGIARAMRFDGEDASVLVERGSRRQWLPIGLVMNEAQARRWITTGFRRGM